LTEESFVSPEIIQGESHAKEFWKISLAEDTVGRRISVFSEYLCDQLIDQYETTHFAL
jgi:hypothetical protein